VRWRRVRPAGEAGIRAGRRSGSSPSPVKRSGERPRPLRDDPGESTGYCPRREPNPPAGLERDSYGSRMTRFSARCTNFMFHWRRLLRSALSPTADRARSRGGRRSSVAVDTGSRRPSGGRAGELLKPALHRFRPFIPWSPTPWHTGIVAATAAGPRATTELQRGDSSQS
jgi:hypothetical protein